MKQLASDVLVLGSGAAGLAAGVTAAESGKRVILLEKNTFFGGATNTVIVVRVLRDDPAFVDGTPSWPNGWPSGVWSFASTM